jgi:hypothetical protein
LVVNLNIVQHWDYARNGEFLMSSKIIGLIFFLFSLNIFALQQGRLDHEKKVQKLLE